MTNKNLMYLAYAGICVFLLDVLCIVVWSKNYSSDKIFSNHPDFAVGLFVIGCLISAFIFSYALSMNGRKSIFIPLLVIVLLVGLAGAALTWFLAALVQLGN